MFSFVEVPSSPTVDLVSIMYKVLINSNAMATHYHMFYSPQGLLKCILILHLVSFFVFVFVLLSAQ